MEAFFQFFSPTVIAVITLFNILVILIILILIIQNRSDINRMSENYGKIFSELDQKSAQQLLEECLLSTAEMKNRNSETEKKLNTLERNFLQTIQKVGIIRFNAFENVGSDLSFAIALLDTVDTGIVLSGIYSRDSSSTYAKPVINGNSKYALSAEEIQAINTAKKNYGERMYTEK